MTIKASRNTSTKARPFSVPRSNADMLNLVKRNTLQWVFDNTNKNTGLVADRDTKPGTPASIASVGFAFYDYAIAAHSGVISRDDAAAWAHKVLTTLLATPDGEAPTGCGKRKGMYYHMLNPATGLRATKADGFWDGIEASTIDTAILVAGAVFARNYFDADTAVEVQIRQMATRLYDEVDWKEYEQPDGSIGMGWTPEQGKINASYAGYCEDPLLYALAIGSSTHPVSADCWKRGLTSRYQIEQLPGMTRQSVVMPGMPMFCYQYPQLLLPFRGIRDDACAKLGMDYWDIAAEAAEAGWQYALDNPKDWVGYNRNADLLTACDGPGDFKMVTARQVRRPPVGSRWNAHYNSQADSGTTNHVVGGVERVFRGYSERGVIHGFEPRIRDGFDDGTTSATATICMLPFPGQKGRVLRVMRFQMKRNGMFTEQGYADSHNDTLNWIDADHVGIDQGPIIIAIQEFQDGMVSRFLQKDASLRRAFTLAGFTGGWLANR